MTFLNIVLLFLSLLYYKKLAHTILNGLNYIYKIMFNFRLHIGILKYQWKCLMLLRFIIAFLEMKINIALPSL